MPACASYGKPVLCTTGCGWYGLVPHQAPAAQLAIRGNGLRLPGRCRHRVKRLQLAVGRRLVQMHPLLPNLPHRQGEKFDKAGAYTRRWV